MHEGLFILKRETVRANYSPKKMRFTYGLKRAKSTRPLHGGRQQNVGLSSVGSGFTIPEIRKRTPEGRRGSSDVD